MHEHIRELLKDCRADQPEDVVLYLDCVLLSLEMAMEQLDRAVLLRAVAILEREEQAEYRASRDRFCAWIRAVLEAPRPVTAEVLQAGLN